ncbi:MAG TPA: SpoIIE family protein phosphatase [Terriglobales bacterium]|jgi:sigma-B regulation protein RsbU (phosphoserine phosphatase)
MRLLARKKKPVVSDPAPIAVPQLNHADLAAVYYGVRQGGDFYDFVRVSPHLVLFGLLDVAGRHEENAGIVAAAQETFRSVGTNLFEGDDINEAEAMIELSLRLNRTIMEASRGVRSCPAFVGCYNELVGTVCYSNAGHTPALLWDGSVMTQLPASGLPLGLFSHVTHDAPTAALAPGAAMVLVSRGVTEAKRGGTEYGIESVQATCQRDVISSARQLCLDILAGVEQFMRAAPTHNDVTALALVRNAAAKAASTDGA